MEDRDARWEGSGPSRMEMESIIAAAAPREQGTDRVPMCCGLCPGRYLAKRRIYFQIGLQNSGSGLRKGGSDSRLNEDEEIGR